MTAAVANPLTVLVPVPSRSRHGIDRMVRVDPATLSVLSCSCPALTPDCHHRLTVTVSPLMVTLAMSLIDRAQRTGDEALVEQAWAIVRRHNNERVRAEWLIESRDAVARHDLAYAATCRSFARTTVAA